LYSASYFSSGTFFWIDDPYDRFISKSEDKSRDAFQTAASYVLFDYGYSPKQGNSFGKQMCLGSESVVPSGTKISEMCLTGHTIH